jgi:lysophospholipase L1-like esterase
VTERDSRLRREGDIRLLKAMLCCAALALLSFIAPGASGQAAAPQGTEWRDAAQFDVEGRGWTETEGPWDRLPARAKGVVPPSVWDLSKHSAGICVRFRASGRIFVRWSLASGNLAMQHMPATGVSGVDLYARGPRGRWLYIGNGRPELHEGNVASFYTGAASGSLRECLLYLPLYNGTAKVEIGVPPGSRVEKAGSRPGSKSRALVVYGTSIVQGGCASRPGMAWPAIVGRMLDRPVVNLGFSGSGRMEPQVAGCLAELDPAAFVVDCLWNMTDLDDRMLTERIETLVRTLRKAHPDTPIVLVGQSNIHPEAHPTHASQLQEEAAGRLRDGGMRRVYLVPGAILLGKDGEGTVDGVHPSDLGMQRQAEALAPILARILAGRAQ